MRSMFFLPALFIFGLSLSSTATTIIPYKYLSQIYLASDDVVVVKAGNPYETVTDNCTHYDCDFTVISSMKGMFSIDDVLSLRRYSYYDMVGHLDITGDFTPQADYFYLIFLDQYAEGYWRPMMMSYYIFEAPPAGFAPGNEEAYWVPVEESLSIGTFPLPDGDIAEPLRPYKMNALMQLLQQYNTHPETKWDPTPALIDNNDINTSSDQSAGDRAIPTGCDFDLGGGLSRWKSQSIEYFYDVTGAPADALTRFTIVIATLKTEYPGLDLSFGGTADFTPDCSDGSVSGNDFIAFLNSNLNGNQSMLLMFEDPCNQMANLNNCAGVLGIGGSYMLSTSHVFKGDTWKDAAWGYVSINNGVRPCLTEINYERLLTHEITHTLKMDHLNATTYPGNNMNPTCCNPINTKDRECMNYVYSLALPVELTAFYAQVKDKHVVLKWSTAQEINNDHFTVEKSGKGIQFETMATVRASGSYQPAVYEITDQEPLRGVNYYRLLQQDFDGTSSLLALRSVTYTGDGARYGVSPNPIRDNRLVVMVADAEMSFESLEILEPAGRVVLQQWSNVIAGGDRLELSVGDLPMGVYWLKIKEGGRSETIKFVRQ